MRKVNANMFDVECRSQAPQEQKGDFGLERLTTYQSHNKKPCP